CNVRQVRTIVTRRIAPLAPFSPYRTAAHNTKGSGAKSSRGRKALVVHPPICVVMMQVPRRSAVKIAGSMCRREGTHLPNLFPLANQMGKTGPIVRFGSALATYQCAQ